MTEDDARDLIPLRHAPAHVPGHPHISTITRWALRGVRGRVLPTVLIGGRRWVRLSKLRNFLEGSSAAHPEPERSEVEKLSQMRAKSAGIELSTLGVRRRQC